MQKPHLCVVTVKMFFNCPQGAVSSHPDCQLSDAGQSRLETI